MSLPNVTPMTPPSKQRLRLWLSMLRATRRLEAALRERMRETYGSTLPRFDVLSALDRSRDGLTMSALSEQLMVSNGNVTGIVERLVEDGLVERRAVLGDKRATRVRLTEAGAETFAAMAARHERWVDELLSDIDPLEAGRIIDALGGLRKDPPWTR